MKEDLIFDKKHPQQQFKTVLEETLKEGARRLLQQAIEIEIEEFLAQGNSSVATRFIRNGYLPERHIQTGIGQIPVNQPRVRDKEKQEGFSSGILPKYKRRVQSLEETVAALYLRGISTNNFQESLEAILGERAKGLSPTNIVRLKKQWEEEYKKWSIRDLSEKRYVYMWVDGIYFKVRLKEDRPCLLVMIGATENGTKELIGIYDGERESKLSWKEALSGLKKRGLKQPPKLAIGDGALGFWSALEEVFPQTEMQRCWVHKTANILDKLPKKMQPKAKEKIHEMYMAPTKKEGLKAFDDFLTCYEDKYPKACEVLKKDREVLFTFYNYPAVHWQHIRTTNPIESTFATVRHRTRQTKGCGSRLTTLSMVFKLVESAEKHWRKLRGYKLIEKVINGIKFEDGEEVELQKKVA